MENRLELFRERIAAFDGAADPIHAIAKGYVIEEPDQYDAINALFKRISLRPQSKNLLIGGIGSGKTTQLLRLNQLFQESRDIDIYSHYIDVTEYARPDDIQVGTLDAIVGLELMKLLKHKKFQLDESRRITIMEFAYGSTVKPSRSDFLDPLENLRALQVLQTSKVSGVLSSHPRSSHSSNRFAQVLFSLIEDFQTVFQQTPYFLFDGLDRLDEAEKFTRIASPDLQASKIGYLIVASASLLYSSFINSIDNIFNHIEYRSAFDVSNDQGARSFFEKVLFARSSKRFFQKAALQDLVILSGGVLRDLVNLTQESIQEAYLADAEVVDQQHVETAVRSMGRAKILGLTQEQYGVLESFAKNTLISPTSPEEIYLLASGRILEYRFPNRRFALHPVLKQLLA